MSSPARVHHLPGSALAYVAVRYVTFDRLSVPPNGYSAALEFSTESLDSDQRLVMNRPGKTVVKAQEVSINFVARQTTVTWSDPVPFRKGSQAMVTLSGTNIAVIAPINTCPQETETLRH